MKETVKHHVCIGKIISIVRPDKEASALIEMIVSQVIELFIHVTHIVGNNPQLTVLIV